MPVSSSIDDSRDLSIFTVKGQLTFQEEMAALKAFYIGEPTTNVLWDFRLLEGNRLSSAELDQLFGFIKANQEKRPQGSGCNRLPFTNPLHKGRMVSRRKRSTERPSPASSPLIRIAFILHFADPLCAWQLLEWKAPAAILDCLRSNLLVMIRCVRNN